MVRTWMRINHKIEIYHWFIYGRLGQWIYNPVNNNRIIIMIIERLNLVCHVH